MGEHESPKPPSFLTHTVCGFTPCALVSLSVSVSGAFLMVTRLVH